MKQFIVLSCLILAANAKPGGYSYGAPSSGALSASLLPPGPAHGHGHSYAYSHSHGLAPISSLSNGGSFTVGSSYSVSPAVYAALASSGISHGPSTTYHVISPGSKIFQGTFTIFHKMIFYILFGDIFYEEEQHSIITISVTFIRFLLGMFFRI